MQNIPRLVFALGVVMAAPLLLIFIPNVLNFGWFIRGFSSPVDPSTPLILNPAFIRAVQTAMALGLLLAVGLRVSARAPLSPKRTAAIMACSAVAVLGASVQYAQLYVLAGMFGD
jgi:hypothetical protein